jgi:hypothetical protein
MEACLSLEPIGSNRVSIRSTEIDPKRAPATVCFGTGRRAGVDCWFTYLKNWTLLLDVQIIAENRVHHRARLKRILSPAYTFQGSRPHRVRLPTSLDRLADDCRELTFNVGRVDGGYRERPITWRQIRNLRTRCTGGGDGNLVVEGCAACSVADYIAR